MLVPELERQVRKEIDNGTLNSTELLKMIGMSGEIYRRLGALHPEFAAGMATPAMVIPSGPPMATPVGPTGGHDDEHKRAIVRALLPDYAQGTRWPKNG